MWDYHRGDAERRRTLVADDWNLDGPRVQAQVWALNDKSQFYLAVNPRVGTLSEIFSCLLSVTLVDEE